MRSALLVMAVAALGGVVEAAGTTDAVTVRIFDYTGRPADAAAAAHREVEGIFAAAGISLRWRHCSVPGRPSTDACVDPLHRGRDLMLRVVERTPAGETRRGRVSALGESIVNAEERAGALMTVDVTPVRLTAEDAGADEATLLGRAIAHEIGHLLLGDTRHARLGLMRALWSRDELRGVKPAHWGFSNREAAQMRQTLRGSHRTAD